jgi:hypothetical protein
MKRRAGFVVSSLFPALASACAEFPEPSAPSHPIVLVRATTEPETERPRRVTETDASLLMFRIGAEPGSGMSQAAIRFSFRNVSGKTMSVLRHPLLGPRGWAFTDVWLEIARVSDSSTAETIWCGHRCGPVRGPPALDDYIELHPGDEFSSAEELRCDYALPDEGPWRIVAHYHDERERPRLDEHTKSSSWFLGHLDSNAIEITVKPWTMVLEASAKAQERWEDEPQRLPQP